MAYIILFMPDSPLLSPQDIDRIIQMACEDRTPLRRSTYQFGLKATMRCVKSCEETPMKSSSFKMWRKRVTGRRTKHARFRSEAVQRFRSTNQKD